MPSIHVALITLAATILVEADAASQTRPMGVHQTETGSSRPLSRSAGPSVVALRVMEGGRLCDRTAATCRSVRADDVGNVRPKLYYYAEAVGKAFGPVELRLEIQLVTLTSNACRFRPDTVLPYEFPTDKWALFNRRDLMSQASACRGDARQQFTLRWTPLESGGRRGAELTSEVLFLVR